mmetsp:Transcript_101360/g.180180  ORF Transcript_101360/g.180180 Transcript_101360/m.180180 type:complete len:167 (-) Transcript_101360:208-708(-)
MSVYGTLSRSLVFLLLTLAAGDSSCASDGNRGSVLLQTSSTGSKTDGEIPEGPKTVRLGSSHLGHAAAKGALTLARHLLGPYRHAVKVPSPVLLNQQTSEVMTHTGAPSAQDPTFMISMIVGTCAAVLALTVVVCFITYQDKPGYESSDDKTQAYRGRRRPQQDCC